MTTHRNPTRQRLVNAALELFAHQGITETTTKQIAELAEVNEVTLFRQFGNKQGLVLAVIEESEIFGQLPDLLAQQSSTNNSPEQILRKYVQAYFQLLETVPELVRSIVGEAGKSPPENKEALGQALQEANRLVIAYFCQAGTPLDNECLVSLINCTLLGYMVLELTTPAHGLWLNRQSFMDSLMHLALSQPLAVVEPSVIADLPASLVHTILQRAQKKGVREYALVYLLFGAGVGLSEIIALERVHYLSDRDTQFLQITWGAVRQVPVNQWILGRRYGNYQKNPLTQWLRGRKDDRPALLLGQGQEDLTLAEIQEIWHGVTQGLFTPDGLAPAIDQAQKTWRVEMLMRGISLESMQILAGLSLEQLAPYAQRAKEKTALEQALELDRPKGDRK